MMTKAELDMLVERSKAHETLRDKIAIAVITGYLAGDPDICEDMESMVDLAYLYADEMLKRRKQ